MTLSKTHPTHPFKDNDKFEQNGIQYNNNPSNYQYIIIQMEDKSRSYLAMI